MKKNILVTGGFGRVGSQLIPLLLAQGHHVRILSRDDSPNSPFRNQVDVKLGDVAVYADVQKALQGMDVVCHLAALFPPLFFDETKIIEVNVLGTFNILQAIKEQGHIERIVFASTDAAYATGPSLDTYQDVLLEDQELWPINVYGITKVVDEVLIRKYSRLYQIPHVILRFFWSMVPAEMPRLMFEARNYMDLIVDEDKQGLSPSDIVVPCLESGEGFLDHITDSRDIARGVYLALINDKALNQTFNIAAADRLDYRIQSPKVAAALGRPLRFVRCRGLKNYEASIEKAHKLLGFTPQYSMDKMVEEALASLEIKK